MTPANASKPFMNETGPEAVPPPARTSREERIVDRFDPDLVIVMLGENDHQSLQTVHGQREAQVGTPAWPPAYRDRVVAMMRIATSRGAKVVWAGLPISADFRVRDHSRRQNEIFEFAASISMHAKEAARPISVASAPSSRPTGSWSSTAATASTATWLAAVTGFAGATLAR